MIRLALVQFPRQARDRKSNAGRMAGYLAGCAPADIVLLPEDWMGPGVIDWPEYLSAVRKLAKALPAGSLLVSGAQYTRTPEGVFSRGLFLGPAGEAVFEKRFPSRAVGERGFVRPGRFSPVLEHRGVKVGAAVCVDLMYPELVRHLALSGAQVILSPANIPADRLDLWRALGLVRAAENTVFVAVANNTATAYGDGRPVEGGSFVARPYGHGFASAGSGEGIHFFEIDPEEITAARKRWPYLDDIQELRNRSTSQQPDCP